MKQKEIQVAVDAIVFTVINNNLKILLIQRKNKPFQNAYALPGGFVLEHENLDTAVLRELEEETGVKNIFVKQLKTYGNVKRDPRGRVISIAYLALINPNQKLFAHTDAAKAEWFSINTLPKLGFDHTTIITDALKQLHYEIQTTNSACQILPVKFTLTEMQQLYEIILQRKLDKRNFRKKIAELDLLKETGDMKRDGAYRPAKLYQFKKQTYTPVSNKVHLFL